MPLHAARADCDERVPQPDAVWLARISGPAHVRNTSRMFTVRAGKQSLLTVPVRSFDAPLTDAGVLQAKAASKLVAALRPQVSKPLHCTDDLCLPTSADRTACKVKIWKRGKQSPLGRQEAGLMCKSLMLFCPALKGGVGKPLVELVLLF